MAWYWKSVWDDDGTRKGQTHGHMHRRAGVRWPMLALMERYQLHSPEPQCVYYGQQEKEGLASLGGWSLARSILWL